MTMSPRPRHLTLALLWPALAFACGACDEDKMAATYDHAVSQDAAAHQKAVVYCAVQGASQPDRLRAVAAQIDGVDPASVRVSSEPAALSFALDKSVQSPEAAVAQMHKALGGQVKLVVIKSVDPVAGR